MGKKYFLYVLDVLTKIYFRLIRNLCSFAIKMAKVRALTPLHPLRRKFVSLILVQQQQTCNAAIDYHADGVDAEIHHSDEC